MCYRILNHLMAMSQENTLQSAQEFGMEKDDVLSESVSTRTGDEDCEDVEIDPIEYYAHNDDDMDDHDVTESKEGLHDREKSLTRDLDLSKFDEVTNTKL